MVQHPLSIDESHVRMNKFRGSDDPGYISVTGRLEIILRSILEDSPLQNADNLLCRDRYSLKNLAIERLSGDSLPMKHCYINLTIIEQLSDKANQSKEGEEGEEAQNLSEFSLLRRLKVQMSAGDTHVPLPNLFESRKTLDGQTRPPKRILIRGRAGVGKTTLCKKIVYEFTQKGMWRDLFRRVLWLPLRNLKGRGQRGGYTFENLFVDEYFPHHPERNTLANALWGAIHDGKTLFILDGLDEVSRDLHDGMLQFLTVLLNQHNVIITSRPNAAHLIELDSVDLELETIGFYPTQVTAYITNAYTNRETDQCDLETVGEIERFLESHPIMQGLMRIPIQLDALCYTWNGSGDKAVPETMTAVYSDIEDRLWRKDDVNLGNHPRSRVQGLREGEILKYVEDELRRLEVLAFTGMHNDVIDFTPKQRNAIFSKFDWHYNRRFFDEILERVSFLRASDPSLDHDDQNYHFLHLTFQEYFAAKYFVRQWEARKPLKCLEFEKENINDIEPVAFLQKQKYSARYDIVWRFVAGLLNATETLRFFETIEDEPRDLLGPTHERLVMHCLSEVSSSRDLPIRSKLEARLSHWLLLEYRLTGSLLLARELECPKKALLMALKTDSRYGTDELVKRLQRSGRHLSEAVVSALTVLLRDDDYLVRASAANALKDQSNLPEETFDALAVIIRDEDEYTVSYATIALRRQPSLPQSTVDILTALLSGTEPHVQSRAACALGGQLNLLEPTTAALAAILWTGDSFVHASAATTLSVQSSLPKSITGRLQSRLESPYWFTRSCAAVALGTRSNLPKTTIAALAEVIFYKNWSDHVREERRSSAASLPETTIMALASLITDSDNEIKSGAQRVLMDQSSIPEAAVTMLVTMLTDKEESTRRMANDILTGLPNLPEAAFSLLVAMLKDEKISTRVLATRQLRPNASKSKLPEQVVIALVPMLKDEETVVNFKAATALRSQSDLPREAVTALLSMIKDKDINTRSWATVALQGQPNQSQAIKALVVLLREKESLARSCAFVAVEEHTNLPMEVIEELVALLKFKDAKRQFSAAKALSSQSNLPKAVVTTLAAMLKESDRDVCGWAALALQSQPDLREAITIPLILALEVKDENKRYLAMNVLRRQQNLPDEAVYLLLSMFGDERFRQYDAAELVGAQSHLPEAAVTSLVTMLGYEEMHYNAANALGGQSKLPDAAVTSLVALLGDGKINDMAAKALRGQSQLPDAAVTALIAMFRKKDRYQNEAANTLEAQSKLSDAAAMALLAILEEDGALRSHAAECLGERSILLDKVLEAMGLFLEPERQAESPSRTVRNLQLVELLYESLLRRSFREQFSWCIDESSRFCINQSDGRQISCFDRGTFLAAISKGRQLETAHGLDLWR